MVWVDSSPTLQAPYVEQEYPLSLISIPHSPLYVILTKSSISVYHQYTLLPLKSHTRTQESLDLHGTNLSCKAQYYSINAAKLQEANHINIFVKTSNTHLIIYLIEVNYNKSFFQVLDSKSDEILQLGLPLINTTSLFSLSNLLKSATRSIITGGDHMQGLENIEHINNHEAEDEGNNFQVPYVKLSIHKILKVSIGIDTFWLKNNSHNLFIFKNSELQIINVKLFNNDVYQFEEFEWYKSETDSPVTYVQYNEWFNYFLFTNEVGDIWYMYFDNENKLQGYKLRDNLIHQRKILIHFNPQVNTFILQRIDTESTDSVLSLFRVESFDHVRLTLIKSVAIPFTNKQTHLTSKALDTQSGSSGMTIHSINWSPCGEFFTVVIDQHWLIFSKFGNCTFNSGEISKELTFEGSQDGNGTGSASINSDFRFLHPSEVLITPNSKNIILIDSSNTTVYLIDLLTLANNSDHSDDKSGIDLIFASNDYLSLYNNEKGISTLYKYPILPHFKNIIRKMSHQSAIGRGRGVVNPGLIGKNCLPARLTIASNSSNQISMSYGDKISLSTPYSTNSIPGDVNHILWFNFKNYFMETMNIIDHFWYQNYLILINRNYNTGEDEKAENGAENVNRLTDEIIILNCSATKYGNGGVNVKFDSDLIIWRYNLKQLIVCHQFQSNESNFYHSGAESNADESDLNGHDLSEVNSSQNGSKEETSDQNLTDNLIVVTNEYKIIIFKFTFSKQKVKRSPQLFIGINKTIYLKTIAQKLLINDISQINLIDDKHFLILLNTGEFYILKNQIEDSKVYDLILLNNCVDFFKFKSIFHQQYMYLFTGSSILVYTLRDIINSTLNTLVYPIIIKLDEYFQPLTIQLSTGKSINLLGLENFASYKNKYLMLKTRINHKLILNNFVESDIIKNKGNKNVLGVFYKYERFSNFHYCLELLLFKYLTNLDNELALSSMSPSPAPSEENEGSSSGGSVLKLLIHVIDSQSGSSSESIYINCLRKIEVGFWHKFFDTLQTTPLKFMNKLISIGEVELCYNYLIIYLNFKKEYEVPVKGNAKVQLLDSQDKQIILSIIKMLDTAKKWDWCFELCRFIKLLDPSSELLRLIKKEVDV